MTAYVEIEGGIAKNMTGEIGDNGEEGKCFTKSAQIFLFFQNIFFENLLKNILEGIRRSVGGVFLFIAESHPMNLTEDRVRQKILF